MSTKGFESEINQLEAQITWDQIKKIGKQQGPAGEISPWCFNPPKLRETTDGLSSLPKVFTPAEIADLFLAAAPLPTDQIGFEFILRCRCALDCFLRAKGTELEEETYLNLVALRNTWEQKLPPQLQLVNLKVDSDTADPLKGPMAKILQKWMKADLYGDPLISERVFHDHPRFVDFIMKSHLNRWIPAFGIKLQLTRDGSPMLPVQIKNPFKQKKNGWVVPREDCIMEWKPWSEIRNEYGLDNAGKIYHHKPEGSRKQVVFTGLAGLTDVHPNFWETWFPIAQLNHEEVRAIQDKAALFRPEKKNPGSWTAIAISTFNRAKGDDNIFLTHINRHARNSTHPYIVMVSPKGLVYNAGYRYAMEFGVREDELWRAATTVPGKLMMNDPFLVLDPDMAIHTYIPVHSKNARLTREWLEEAQANPRRFNLITANCTKFTCMFLEKCGVEGASSISDYPIRRLLKEVAPPKKVTIPLTLPVSLPLLAVYGVGKLGKKAGKGILGEERWEPFSNFSKSTQDLFFASLILSILGGTKSFENPEDEEAFLALLESQAKPGLVGDEHILNFETCTDLPPFPHPREFQKWQLLQASTMQRSSAEAKHLLRKGDDFVEIQHGARTLNIVPPQTSQPSHVVLSEMTLKEEEPEGPDLRDQLL